MNQLGNKPVKCLKSLHGLESIFYIYQYNEVHQGRIVNRNKNINMDGLKDATGMMLGLPQPHFPGPSRVDVAQASPQVVMQHALTGLAILVIFKLSGMVQYDFDTFNKLS